MKTSLYTILCIVVRLGAVLLAAGTVVAIPNLYFVGHTIGISGDTVPLMALLYLGSLIVAFVLWIYPDILARLATGKSAKEVFEFPIDARTIQYIALSVLGVSVTLKGLVAIVFEIFRWATISSRLLPGESVLSDELPRLASGTTQIILGIALTLGAKG